MCKLKNLPRVITGTVSVLLLLAIPVSIVSQNKTLLFYNEKTNAYVAITTTGDLVSTVPITQEQGSFAVAPGNIIICKASAPDDNIIGISETGVKIRKKICEKTQDVPGAQSLQFDYTNAENCEAFSPGEGINDLSIRGTIYTPDNTGPQPTYHRIYSYQTEDDPEPITRTNYFDGFGRGVQTQLKKDILFSQVKGVYYDEAGHPQIETKTTLLPTIDQFYTMCEDDNKKLLIAANNSWPEAGGKAYAEDVYYYEPLRRLKAGGSPGIEYSIEGHHTITWYFGITRSNLEPGLDQWFNTDGFLLPTKLVLLSDEEDLILLDDLLKTIYEATPDAIKYSLTVIKDANDHFIQIIKDKFGRTVRTWADAEPEDNSKGDIVVEYSYDIMGNPLEEQPPKNRDEGGSPVKILQNTERIYTTLGQLIRETTPDKGENYEHDAAGNLIRVIKAAGSDNVDITLFYDKLDRIITIKANGADQIKYYYDNTDNMSDLEQYLLNSDDISILNNITTELENLRGNLVAEISIGYNPEGSQTVPDKNRCIVDLYSYDEDGRLKADYKYIPGVSWQKTKYTYDLQDKITRKEVQPQYLNAQAPAPNILTYAYDNQGQLTDVVKDDPNNKIITHTYDDIGRLTNKSYYKSDGSTVARTTDFSYTIRDWIKEINSGDLFTEHVDYTGDYAGNITSVIYDYNIGGTSTSYNLGYTYDGINRLTAVQDIGKPASLYNEAFSYDQVGRIMQKRRGSNTLSGFTPIYEYNILTNKLNHITETQAVDNYAYDGRGNMIADKSKKMDAVTYDWRDMPVRFLMKDGSEPWQSTVDMVYDASGNRVLKKETVVRNGSTESAKAVAYVNDDMVYENDNYQVEPYSLMYFNIDEDGRMNYPSNTNEYFIKDHLGSTRCVITDEGEGADVTMYDAYGKMEQLAHSSINRVRDRFTGKELDEDGAVDGETNGLELYYFGKRFYDPEIGRWTSTDKQKQFFNAYNYCGNNPLTYIDPDGGIAGVAALALDAALVFSLGYGLYMSYTATTGTNDMAKGKFMLDMGSGNFPGNFNPKKIYFYALLGLSVFTFNATKSILKYTPYLFNKHDKDDQKDNDENDKNEKDKNNLSNPPPTDGKPKWMEFYPSQETAPPAAIPGTGVGPSTSSTSSSTSLTVTLSEVGQKNDQGKQEASKSEQGAKISSEGKQSDSPTEGEGKPNEAGKKVLDSDKEKAKQNSKSKPSSEGNKAKGKK